MARTLLESHPHPKYPRLTLDLRADSKFYQARIFLDSKRVSGRGVSCAHEERTLLFFCCEAPSSSRGVGVRDRKVAFDYRLLGVECARK
jgi:hypothetical protein